MCVILPFKTKEKRANSVGRSNLGELELQLYAVKYSDESDWVVACTPKEAINISLQDRNLLDNVRGMDNLVVVLIAEQRARQIRLIDDDIGVDSTLWEEFLETTSPAVIATWASKH